LAARVKAATAQLQCELSTQIEMADTKKNNPEVPGRLISVGLSAIYLDSQPVSAGDGFALPAATEEILELARAVRVEILVPEAVLIELTVQFERSLRSATEDLREASRRHSRLLGVRDMPVIDDVEANLKRHRQGLDDFLQRFGVRVVPFPQRSNRELFLLAAQRKRPFRESGKGVTDAGFKDAVIFLSVADDLRDNPRSAAFISRDPDFAGADELLAPGMTLQRATVSEMIEALRSRQHVESLEAAEQRRNLANTTLHDSANYFSELERFVSARFYLPANVDFIDVPVYDVHQIKALSVVAAEVRNLVPLMNDVSPGESVRLTIFALARLDILARANSPRKPPTPPPVHQWPGVLRVGEERPTQQASWRPEEIEWDTSFVPRVLQVVAIVEATQSELTKATTGLNRHPFACLPVAHSPGLGVAKLTSGWKN
jgi:PIN domain